MSTEPSPTPSPITPPTWPADKIEMRDPATLKPHPKNPRKHSDAQVLQIRSSVEEFGWTVPVVIDEKGRIWGGHGRVMAALLEPKIPNVPCVIARNLTETQKTAYMLSENRTAENSEWDRDLLRDHLKALDGVFDLAKAGFDAITLPTFLSFDFPGGAASGGQSGAGSLAEKFGIPPFSILNAREGWWQDRKRAWLALGIQSELGRGEASPGGSDRPAADYSNGERGDGVGKAKRKPNAMPGGVASSAGSHESKT